MSYIGNAPISAAFLTDTFSGNGSTVAFTMTVAPANTSSILVSITGVLQDPSTYSVSGTTLTFSSAPPSGTSNISVRYLGIPASGVTTTAYRTVTNFTATAGQTSFSTPSYTVGYIDVYRNGVRLVSTDFTATTGTTVVLANACTVGDSVVTESFLVSSVLNAIQQYNGSSTNQTLTNPIIVGSTPQFTSLTSGSGTYTVPANCRWLQVRMVGSGGGGGGSGGAGSAGGTTTFGSVVANGGSGGLASGSGGSGTNRYAAGGSGGSGTATLRVAGQNGQTGQYTPSPAYGGMGGSTLLGFGGAGAATSATSGGAAPANSGGGGGGGCDNFSGIGGCGGGGGEYAEIVITSPSATYSYAITAGGAGGGSTYVGGAGGSGVIYVTAYF